MMRVASSLTLRPPRNPVLGGASAGLGVVRGGCTVAVSHTPTSACPCCIGACPRCSALYPRTPIPTIARRVGRPCFHSHAMALSFPTRPLLRYRDLRDAREARGLHAGCRARKRTRHQAGAKVSAAPHFLPRMPDGVFETLPGAGM